MQWLAEPTGKRGRQAKFTDTAIQSGLTLKALFGLPLRQVTGLVASLLELARLDWPGSIGRARLAGLDLPVPDFSTLCRRQKGLLVAIAHRPCTGALHGGPAPADRQHGDQGGGRRRMVFEETRPIEATTNGARFTLELTRKPWKSAPSK